MTLQELFEDPARWCQFDFGRDKDSNRCLPTDERACQWCLAGGLNKCYPADGFDAAYIKLYAALEKIGGYCATMWNDQPGRTHAEVLDLVKVAGI